MLKIKIVKEDNNGNEQKVNFNPRKIIKDKMEDYYNNPDHLMIDAVVVGCVSLAIERGAYALNSISRAVRTARDVRR